MIAVSYRIIKCGAHAEWRRNDLDKKKKKELLGCIPVAAYARPLFSSCPQPLQSRWHKHTHRQTHRQKGGGIYAAYEGGTKVLVGAQRESTIAAVRLAVTFSRRTFSGRVTSCQRRAHFFFNFLTT
jgi:hypothetical protein